MQFYSWKDVERHCLMNQQLWKEDFDLIEVYPSAITVYRKESMRHSADQTLNSLLGNHFDKDEKQIKLDIGNVGLPIYEEETQSCQEKPILPLFRNILYRTTSYPYQEPPVLPKPLVAFHSYKGGVGRTLSLIAYAKAWSTVFEETDSARLLIVESDIEAPGLTWLQDCLGDDTFSYLDLLTLIQDNTDMEQIVELACSKIKNTTIAIETPTRTIEHVFIPTYRYEEQLLDLYATPDSIINGRSKEYALATVISKICDRLKLSAALVDLRAGISEFSSTLLLDPRVKKYLVTSTSTQSIKGTEIILKYLMRGLSIKEDTMLPEVFLNMIPEALTDSEKNEMLSELLQYYEQAPFVEESASYIDNVITELPFASELIHLVSMKQILNNLTGRDLYLKLQKLIRQNYNAETNVSQSSVDENERNDALKRIHELAGLQLTAESSNKFEVLMTESLKYLSRKYSDTLPATVIMGAKGAGKTFLYKKMVETLDWNHFCETLNNLPANMPDCYFLPIIATKNSSELIDVLKACIQNINQNISCAHVEDSVFLDNGQKLEQKKAKCSDWMEFWENLIASSVNPAWNTLDEADQALETCGKKVIFLIDGLEDILNQVSKFDEEKKAIRFLCQDIVTQIIAKYRNLGIIIFLRRDMAQASIPVNFKQFEQTYRQAELKWSSNEALRLAVWLVNQAIDGFYKGPKEIDSASQDVIEENLVRLWGLKLGKPSSNEAYSSRWILAALSDFNGQLQARDIIRFLKYATKPNNKRPTYNDRYLMPAEIRAAVSTCSTEKMEEVKQEYTALKPIFERLEQLPPDDKVLPLDPGHTQLSSIEEKSMISEGYLKRDGDKYYLPEIIRHALGFRYNKGARPKVLSLTLKH